MAYGGKRRSSALGVILFLLLLAAVFIYTAASLISPSASLIKSSFSESVALVRVEGVIIDGKEIIKQLEKWSDDSSVKAIVLRIVSPGGVVTPSQEIFNAVKKAKVKKPVVASMGSMAASGGYYIASAANKIMASPGTITGSIGVIIMFSNTEKLMGKIGLDTIVVKSGKFKDTGSPHRKFTEADKAIIQGVVDDTYEQFIADVAEGRNMDIEVVRKLADGRIYTGRQAKENNLVDDLGYLDDAISMAGKMGGIVGKPDVVEKKEELSIIRRLLGKDFEVHIFNRFFLPTGTYFLWPAW